MLPIYPARLRLGRPSPEWGPGGRLQTSIFVFWSTTITLAGGQAYRLYQAAFDRTPDLAGLGFQINALDQGLALWQVAGNFIVSPEFQGTFGALNHVQFVTQLYANVLHRAPDQGGLAYHVDHLAHGFTRADILIGFSESP